MRIKIESCYDCPYHITDYKDERFHGCSQSGLYMCGSTQHTIDELMRVCPQRKLGMILYHCAMVVIIFLISLGLSNWLL